MVQQPAPFVRLAPGFGQSSLDFTLNCYVRKFVDQYLVQHELRKRIFVRLRNEEIELPFPTRTVYMHDASEAAPAKRIGKPPAYRRSLLSRCCFQKQTAPPGVLITSRLTAV